jgi:uridine kinase
LEDCKVHIIGVSGGSGSGKTYFAQHLTNLLGTENCLFIAQDHYYIDQSHRFDKDGGSVNFDHPDALDFNLLEKHLMALKNGLDIEIPIYDFATHKRLAETTYCSWKPIIIVDGILVLSRPNIRKHFHTSVFVETPENIRFERRLERDVKERGRTPEGVKAQFEKQVKPMHDEFVEPSKTFANIITSGIDPEIFNNCMNKVYQDAQKYIKNT